MYSNYYHVYVCICGCQSVIVSHSLGNLSTQLLEITQVGGQSDLWEAHQTIIIIELYLIILECSLWKFIHCL